MAKDNDENDVRPEDEPRDEEDIDVTDEDTTDKVVEEERVVRREYPERDARYDRSRGRRDEGERRGGLSWLWATLGILGLLILAWIAYSLATGRGLNINQQQQQQQEQNQFESERQTANFQKSAPGNTETVAEPPVNVVVQTSSPSAQNSTVTINQNNQDYGTGPTFVLGNGLLMRRAMDPNAPDGIYTVNYKSCGTDGNCQEGSYQFRVNWSQREGYTDLTGRSTVNVSYDGQKFNPENFIISKGARVTWINASGGPVTIRSEDKAINELIASVRANLNNNSAISFTLNQAGSYPIRIRLNDNEVTANVIVQ